MNEQQPNIENENSVTQPKKPQNVLKNRNFVLLFLGTLVTNVGAMFYSFAISFYILDLTGNNALIQGIYLAFCGIIYVVMSPFGGVLADRWKKAKVIFMCDYIRGAFIGLSAVATFFIMKAGNVNMQVILLFGIGLVSNVISAVFDPASASLLPLIVDEESVQQGNSYFQILRNLQSILGILLAGILYSLVPIHILFAIIAGCYLISGFSEMFIKHEYTPPANKTTLKNMVADFRDGINYLKTQKAFVAMLFLLLFINFFFSPFYSNGMPYFIKTYVA
ncbi:MAG TPA: MFS transporter, partial [Clostridia bacterium]|nr:MFS transporter [Clostridia bacterium]